MDSGDMFNSTVKFGAAADECDLRTPAVNKFDSM